MNYVKCLRCGEPEHPDNCTIPEIPGGPKYATVVDGCVVHGDVPLTPASREAVSEIIAAVREKLK